MKQQYNHYSISGLLFVVGFIANLSAPSLANIRDASPPTSQRLGVSGPQYTRSNGTDSFSQTVIMISIDGMRADYLDRSLTPILASMAKDGVRAEYMTPSFPSTTFANHYTLVTGLYPQSHGIVSNTFYDPVTKETFNYKDPKHSQDSKWWGGEPIWVTAVKQGLRSAVHMWPGSSSVIAGGRPTYLDLFDSKVTLPQKADRILEWLDMPKDKRPQLINTYVANVDTQGHNYGPNSKEVNVALAEVDAMMDRLFAGLKEKSLDIVNVVVVSDHGMTEVSEKRAISLDKIIDMNKISGNHGYPLALLTPHSDSDIIPLYQTLLEASKKMEFNVYLRNNVPKEYHFSNKFGWVFVTGTNTDIGKGTHGYNNAEVEMRASFLARGPEINASKGVKVAGFPNVQLYNLIARLLNITPARNEGEASWISTSNILKSKK
ncbi:alkaline-phosphatase-like protein [Syncephalis fuscata]|nr:alkaline-phosphatase-like protein [Syncephalis fuscata]